MARSKNEDRGVADWRVRGHAAGLECVLSTECEKCLLQWKATERLLSMEGRKDYESAGQEPSSESQDE